MKKTILLTLVTLIGMNAWAQKFAYVDTEYILNKIPSYKAAQEQLDKLSAQYQKEIEEKYAEVDKMYKDYQTEKVLLTEEMKQKREDDIIAAERKVKELQMKYFGREGMLFKKREELVKPIQDQVFNAIKEIAVEGGYAVIFDAAASPNMIYTNPRYDKSDEVLQRLGFK
ncbi:MAG: outer membrane protein [Tenuifilum sp.]|jgi:outer membrane protein|uniref:OmpH family outer membrane protein n=1 Tax=Tenuifilum thalassicum TaxID=2590900 RepID=A0A7D4BYC2_9BACT|nr:MULTISPECIES: OmpH family outer membrane protein [Tenuifilum]MDI3526589.1 outer membrane protein [Tenuifilum sp.]QKG79004.1 OmpH family outer membrane protein [Tenuifilum thalassicum]